MTPSDSCSSARTLLVLTLVASTVIPSPPPSSSWDNQRGEWACPPEGLPFHEWLIEFEAAPKDLKGFEKAIDVEMQKQNSYYLDLIKGKVLQPMKISQVKTGGFKQYMKTIGKLGGQNKTPRLSNDRKIASYMHFNNFIK